MKKCLPLLIFIVGWLALRMFWIDSDSGIASMWEYGFHVTDEGYYLGGGKEMHLWGSFVDLPRQENLNYGYSAGTHWLSYLAHCLFGLSTWTWRIPFVLLYFVGWLMMYRYVEKKSGPWFACVSCLAVSCIPLVAVYERGGSNDMLIGALLMTSFALAVGEGRWRIPVSAAVMGYIVTIKPSVWAFIPIVLAGVLDGRKTRYRWLDAVSFVALSVLSILAWEGVMALTVLDVARASGLSPWKVLASVHANYGLPSVFDVAKDLLCASTFPRDPTSTSLAGVVVLITVVPLASLLVGIVRHRWSGRLLLYLGVPLYVGGLTLIATQYSHYYLPMIVMLPAVFSALREDFAGPEPDRAELRRAGIECLFGLAVVGVAFLFMTSANVDVRAMAKAYSRIYNFPEVNVWTVTWPYLLLCVVAGVSVLSIKRGMRALKVESWLWAVVLFGVASVSFAVYPACVTAPYLRVASEGYYAALAVDLGIGLVFAYLLLGCPRILADRRVVLALPVVTVVACYLSIPSWRSAAVELVTPGTYVQATVAQELGKLVPPDAVVLGERSTQAFMSLSNKTATTFLANSNPLPVIESLRKQNPNVKLYALADTQHNYMLQHFLKNRDKVRLDLVKTFKMPSFATGKPVDVHLCKITVKKHP